MPCALVHRIGAVAEPVLQRAGRRLAGCLQDCAIHVEQPAVVAAAYPLGADQAELERRAAMWAVPLQQPDRAAAVAKHHQLLAEDFDRQRQVLEVIRVADRLPEPTHVLATGRIRPDMSQFGILLRNVPVMVAAVTRFKNGALVAIASLLPLGSFPTVASRFSQFTARY